VQDVIVPADESDDEYQVIAKKPKTAETPNEIMEETQLAPAPAPAPAVATEDASATDVDAAMPDAPDAAAAVDQPPTTDDDWLRSKTNRLLDLVEDDDVPVAPASAPSKPAAEKRDSPVAAEQQPPKPTLSVEEAAVAAAPSEEDKIRDTGRLYLRNLHFEVAEEDIRTQFSKYGSLDEVSFNPLLPPHPASRMNVKIGTTDAQAFEVTL
jgi:multiple RNA-binding domain-containing protein 1